MDTKWSAELDALMPDGEHWIIRADSDGMRSWIGKVNGNLIATDHGSPETIARLLAAAPDLLEALQAILAQGDRSRSCVDVYKMTHAAIAKATGQ